MAIPIPIPNFSTDLFKQAKKMQKIGPTVPLKCLNWQCHYNLGHLYAQLVDFAMFLHKIE